MSVYNEKESYLKESIKSILNQSFSDFEFIIINDGSTHPCVKEILYQYKKQDERIRMYNNDVNLGLTKSLNLALSFAKGKYIARIDSDDKADSRRLEKQLEFMEKNKNLALCGTWSYFIDKYGKITGEKKSPTTYEKIRKKLLYYNFFTHSSFFFQKSVALRLGGYSENIKKAQDYDFVLKLSAHHPVAIIPEFLCLNRIHPESISSRSKKKQEWYALCARWNAIWKYGYSKINILKILPPLAYFLLVPYAVQKKIFSFIK